MLHFFKINIVYLPMITNSYDHGEVQHYGEEREGGNV